MDIRNKTVLVIGGWGLVGNSFYRKLIPEGPRRIIITSLKKEFTGAPVQKQLTLVNPDNNFYKFIYVCALPLLHY